MKKTISIQDWHLMAVDGDAPSVRILLNGNSMFPLVRKNKDYVTIDQLEQEFRVGDIVLFHESKMEKYVVHRVWEIRDDQVLTWGDNCSFPDVWLTKEDIWGKVTLVEHGRRQIVPNPKKGLRWAKFWHKTGKVYRWLGKVWHGLIDRK